MAISKKEDIFQKICRHLLLTLIKPVTIVFKDYDVTYMTCFHYNFKYIATLRAEHRCTRQDINQVNTLECSNAGRCAENKLCNGDLGHNEMNNLWQLTTGTVRAIYGRQEMW